MRDFSTMTLMNINKSHLKYRCSSSCSVPFWWLLCVSLLMDFFCVFHISTLLMVSSISTGPSESIMIGKRVAMLNWGDGKGHFQQTNYRWCGEEVPLLLSTIPLIIHKYTTVIITALCTGVQTSTLGDHTYSSSSVV